MKRMFFKAALVALLGLIPTGPAMGAPGDLDPSFGINGRVFVAPGTTLFFSARDLAIQPDGKLITVGGGLVGGVIPRRMIVSRFNTDGSPDTSFGGTGQVYTNTGWFADAEAAALQPDGKIVVAGTGRPIFASEFMVARFNLDGSPDTSFGTNGVVTTNFGAAGTARSVLVQPDGKILAAGISLVTFALARYNPDGSLDAGFGSGGKVFTPIGPFSEIHDITLQNDGKIIAVGSGFNGFLVARYDTSGNLDFSFGSGGFVSTPFSYPFSHVAHVVRIQPDGQILVAGRVITGPNFTTIGLIRYNPDGTLDGSFGSGGTVVHDFGIPINPFGADMVIEPGGKIVVGAGDAGESNRDFALVRYNPDGTVDTGFGTNGLVTTDFGLAELGLFPGTRDIVQGLVRQPDGKLVAAGRVSSGFSLFGIGIARYSSGTPAELTQILMDKIVDFNLLFGITNSLLAKLEGVLDKIQTHPDTACNQLDSFINQVQALSGKKIEPEQADEVISLANEIKALLGC